MQARLAWASLASKLLGIPCQFSCFASVPREKRERERERERELSSFHRFFQRDRMEFTALSRVQFLPRDFFVFSRGGSLHVDDR